MAEENDCTTCYVCLEDFEENGGHVPRILPCHHSVCEKCLSQLAEGNHLNCPECRARHYFNGEIKTFPQNKYILSCVREMAMLKTRQEGAMRFEICREHARDLSLYCQERQCHKVICQLCLLKQHRMHDVVDIEEVEAQQLVKEKEQRKKEEKLKRQREMEEIKKKQREIYENFKKGEEILVISLYIDCLLKLIV